MSQECDVFDAAVDGVVAGAERIAKASGYEHPHVSHAQLAFDIWKTCALSSTVSQVAQAVGELADAARKAASS